MTTTTITAKVPAILSNMLVSFCSVDGDVGDVDDGPEFAEAQAACKDAKAGQANELTMSLEAWEVLTDDMLADNDKDGFDGNDAEFRVFRAKKSSELRVIRTLESAIQRCAANRVL